MLLTIGEISFVGLGVDMASEAIATKDLAVEALHVMSTEDRAQFARLIHPEATNREAIAEPPGCRDAGPDAFLATARWLHAAFSDLRWEVHDAVEDRDLVVLHATRKGRQTGPVCRLWTGRPAESGVSTDRADLRRDPVPLVSARRPPPLSSPGLSDRSPHLQKGQCGGS
jgi:SnoaL-like polyketide cyclase